MHTDASTDGSFVCRTFNCKGFKSQAEYIALRLKENVDIMCLSETWLRPQEIGIIDQFLATSPDLKDKKFHVFSKSAMADIEPGFIGRPFGGVFVVCKENSYVSYKQIECSSDRIVCVGIYDSDDHLIQTVCSVYMPF